MSYRHRKGNRERPMLIVPYDGGFFSTYDGRRWPIRIYISGRIEDDYLPKHIKRGSGTRAMVAAITRRIYGHGVYIPFKYAEGKRR